MNKMDVIVPMVNDFLDSRPQELPELVAAMIEEFLDAPLPEGKK
jgi:hypothetical protein